MRRPSVIAISIFLCLLVTWLAGCSENPAEQFIQGKWAQGDVHYWAEWNFDNGSYWYEYDDTHSNIYEKGHYIIRESGEDYIVLELVDRKGDELSIEEKVEVRIAFDPESDKIHIRQSDFTRVSNSTLEGLTTQQAP